MVTVGQGKSAPVYMLAAWEGRRGEGRARVFVSPVSFCPFVVRPLFLFARFLVRPFFCSPGSLFARFFLFARCSFARAEVQG